MVDLVPFRGLRFGDGFARPSVFAPPYDVISPTLRAALLAQDAHNVVHIDLGPGESDPGWYAEAAGRLRAWETSGVLRRDGQPALYGYLQEFTLADGVQRSRLGVLGRVRLTPWGQGIYRHEHTRVGPRQDRLNLMRATRAQLSPVWGLYEDPAGEISALLAPPERPWMDLTDADGVRHCFWPITEEAPLVRLVGALAQRAVVIADGHHRYETALTYRDEMRAAEGNPAGDRPYDFVLMYLTAAFDPGLVILPTHRVVTLPNPPDWPDVLNALAHDFEVIAVPPHANLSMAISTPADGAVTLGAYLGRAGAYVLRLRDVDQARKGARTLQEAELADLDVSVLQNLVLEKRLGVTREMLAHSNVLSYTIHEAEARQMVDAGGAHAAFMLNATTMDQIWSASLRDVTMPQKSTYFYPKLLTGLVLNPLDRD
jgi:uncharacterized protein (DUF1015 family)